MKPISKLALVEDLYENGEYLKALKAAEEILVKEPHNILALRLKASVCTVIGNKSQAIGAYKLVLSLTKSENDLWDKSYLLKSIASLYWDLKKPVLAVNYLEKVQKIYEMFYHQDEEPVILTLLTIGEYQAKSGIFPDAIATYQRLLELYSKHGPLEGIAETFYELGLIYYNQNDLDRSYHKFSNAVKLHTSNLIRGYCYYYLGCILFVRKKFKKSLTLFKSSIVLLDKVYAIISDVSKAEEDPFYCRAVKFKNSLRKKYKFKILH